MTNHHDEPIPTENSFLLDDNTETQSKPVNITIDVYLYGQTAPTDTYQFED